jgi:hypothetical protein
VRKKNKRMPGIEEAHPFRGMSRIHPYAAGVDIGAIEIVACVAGHENTQIVKAFGNYTVDLHALAQWLKSYHIKTVAMESTGVYWIPLFEEQWNARALNACSSALVRCEEWQAERVTLAMHSGSKPYTHMVCWKDRFAPREN